MTETTVNRVAELYKEKSNLLAELSILTDNEKYCFELSYGGIGFLNIGRNIELKSVSQSFLAEIKKLTENHIKLRIEEIDNELKGL